MVKNPLLTFDEALKRSIKSSIPSIYNLYIFNSTQFQFLDRKLSCGKYKHIYEVLLEPTCTNSDSDGVISFEITVGLEVLWRSLEYTDFEG